MISVDVGSITDTVTNGLDTATDFVYTAGSSLISECSFCYYLSQGKNPPLSSLLNISNNSLALFLAYARGGQQYASNVARYIKQGGKGKSLLKASERYTTKGIMKLAKEVNNLGARSNIILSSISLISDMLEYGGINFEIAGKATGGAIGGAGGGAVCSFVNSLSESGTVIVCAGVIIALSGLGSEAGRISGKQIDKTIG